MPARPKILGLLAVAVALLAPGVAHGNPARAGARLTIVLPLRADDAGLAAFVRAVATPGSPSYGAYEPLALLAHRFGAPARVRARVASYLRSAGARAVQVSPTGMFVRASLTVAEAEQVFHTGLARYTGPHGDYIAPTAPSGALARAAAARPAVPPSLRPLVTGVIGLDTDPLVSAAPARSGQAGRLARASAALGPGPGQPPSAYEPATGTPAGCAGALGTHAFTPNQYLTAYGFGPLSQAGLTGRGERVALIEIDGFKLSDIRTFASCFGLRVPTITTSVVGGSRALAPGGEATLDLEVTTAAAPGLDQVEVYESGGDAAQVVDSFAAPLIKPGAKPQVLSASLGLCEPDMYESFGRAGIEQVERDVELAAATGITLLSSSGDSGSSGCEDARGNPRDALAVDYPASSPDVTAVGGTNFSLDAGNALAEQVVWNDTSLAASAGGGGVSSLFARPTYQKGISSPSGRSVPDVAALADVAPGYAIYCTASSEKGCGGWTNVGGTSAAAPLVAGGLALIDQDLHRRDREFLGLINPLLYRLGSSQADRAKVFSDVTEIGNDLGPFISRSGHPLGCCEATPGYDAASGWGSLNMGVFDTFAQAALPLFGNVSLAIPRPQRPGRLRGIRVSLTCSAGCRANAFGFVDLGNGGGFDLQSRTFSFTRAGTRRLKVAFTAGEAARLRRALAHRRHIVAELFGLALDARGQVAKVTAGVELTIRG